MKGDLVITRSISGPNVCRVVEVKANIIFIASPEQFELRERGLPTLNPVGFRADDVFQYEPKLKKEIARGKVEWNRLKPYKEKTKSSKT